MPLNYLTCEKNGVIERQHNNNNNSLDGVITVYHLFKYFHCPGVSNLYIDVPYL